MKRTGGGSNRGDIQRSPNISRCGLALFVVRWGDRPWVSFHHARSQARPRGSMGIGRHHRVRCGASAVHKVPIGRPDRAGRDDIITTAPRATPSCWSPTDSPPGKTRWTRWTASCWGSMLPLPPIRPSTANGADCSEREWRASKNTRYRIASGTTAASSCSVRSRSTGKGHRRVSHLSKAMVLSRVDQRQTAMPKPGERSASIPRCERTRTLRPDQEEARGEGCQDVPQRRVLRSRRDCV